MMNFRLLFLIVTVLGPATVFGATAPAYTNLVRLIAPPAPAPNIDANLFVNQAYFEVNDFFFPLLPFQTLNTLSFINESSGTMAGSPGYRFDYFRSSNNSRNPMASWLNKNVIMADSTNQFFFSSTAQWLLVSATNISNPGLLSAGPQSLIQLDGKNVHLVRGRLRTGNSTNFNAFSGGAYAGSTNDYFNDLGITDMYWAEGSSNVVRGMGSLMQLNVPAGFPSFVPPYRSPFHEVIENFGGFLFTNQTFVGDQGFFLPENNVYAVAYSNQIGGEIVIQAVFVATNRFEPSITPEVRFLSDGDQGRTVVVAYHSKEYDVVLDREITNSIYLLDALAFDTNVVLTRNLAGSTRRPSSYEVTRGLRFSPFTLTNQFIYSPPNISISNAPLYRTTFTDSAVGVQYAAYAAQMSSFAFLDPAVAGTIFSDPTNFPGRVEIWADTLNMRDARIRADSTLILKANNLVSNAQARISAPIINYDVGTTQPALIISNLAPPSVSRLSGGIRAYSATWRNTDVLPSGATNNWRFHVLFVDNTLTTNQPVTLNKFHARGPDLMIHDPLTVRQSIRVEGNGLHIKPGGGLTFPLDADWTASTMVNLVNFTNDGRVTVPGGAFVGTDRTKGYDHFINRGTNEAQVWSIWTGNFENPGYMAAVSGAINITANTVTLHGRPPTIGSVLVTNFSVFPPVLELQPVTNVFAKLAAITDVNINASSVTMSNATLIAGIAGSPGAVIISAASRLSDAGPQHTNYWITTGGIRAPRRPTQWSDLIGTYALVKAPAFSLAETVWDGKNLGPYTIGYSNNLALGKLTLDGGDFSQFKFTGLPGKENAIYVDYLELLNNATNYNDPDVFVFDPNVVIYFAHANVLADKLDGAQSTNRPFGHIRWVPSFTGPLSTTNITYPSGNTYAVNISLAQDRDRDSDGDGTVNSKDPTPVYTAETVGLSIANDLAQPRVLLSWQVLANSTSHVEYKPIIASSGPWLPLRSTTAPSNMRMFMPDVTTGRTQRIYRVRVDLPPQ